MYRASRGARLQQGTRECLPLPTFISASEYFLHITDENGAIATICQQRYRHGYLHVSWCTRHVKPPACTLVSSRVALLQHDTRSIPYPRRSLSGRKSCFCSRERGDHVYPPMLTLFWLHVSLRTRRYRQRSAVLACIEPRA